MTRLFALTAMIALFGAGSGFARTVQMHGIEEHLILQNAPDFAGPLQFALWQHAQVPSSEMPVFRPLLHAQFHPSSAPKGGRVWQGPQASLFDAALTILLLGPAGIFLIQQKPRRLTRRFRRSNPRPRYRRKSYVRYASKISAC